MMTVEENRKRVRRNNWLISLLFLIMITGVAGAVYFYNNLKNAKLSLQKEKKEVELLRDKLQNQNARMQIVLDSVEDFKNILDSIASTTHVSRDFEIIRKNLDNILKPVIVSRDSARMHARNGYDKLIKKDLVGAMEEFGKSENSYNGYHESYEINMLLKKNKDKLNDPAVQRELLIKIKNDYNSLQKLNKNNIQ